ncbi:Imidazoleglycerol-phosphate dehydratase [Desulfovibrio sp. X2]|uniref:imidazoleglycerol-phosphate dehydratase HisB n=1 Tax=Desulfovibrio sp. X2 TaxID=941449 RepID=UPI00035894C2|nr:imidazoleglycerol-phosphate dehydratase HisB [Desulfovibrio sp. X2]EPR42814.1 Imidazoleglycerol-phosphate dehydratase [Desulfovibrio sp. X2]
MSTRKAAISRETRETSIRIELDCDGSGKISVDTGFGFADHMLTLLAFWAGFDLSVTCKGDLEIDAHHSLEDVGLTLGQALAEALGDKQGIERVGLAKVPMDEALSEVVVDLSGRPYFVYLGDEILPPVIAGEEKDVWREFLKSFAYRAQFNLHLRFEYGTNGHHLLESAFKGLGLALRAALRQSRSGVTSTKGSLD